MTFFSCKDKNCDGCKEDARAIRTNITMHIFDDIEKNEKLELSYQGKEWDKLKRKWLNS